MPAKRKPAATKRRKRRSAAATTPTRKKTTKRRKKRSTAARAATTRRRRRTKAAAKTGAKRPRRRTTARRKRTGATHKKKATVRRRPKRRVAVKKKPSKTASSKKTSKSSRARTHGKPGTVKRVSQEAHMVAPVLNASTEAKQKQLKSDSRAYPVMTRRPLPKIKMLETNKPKKQLEKKKVLVIEAIQESGSARTEADTGISPYKERPGEDYMNSDQRAHFRRLLLQRKRRLLEDMGRTVHHLQDEGAPLPDMSDRATQEEEFTLELRARDRERKLIKKIEDALQQLDEGSYGLCGACGVEIGLRRLEARPTASLCIDCKTVDEIREKQMGG